MVGVLLCFKHPIFYVNEGFSVSDIEYEQEALGSFVVCGCDGLELFLACSVPDLKFDNTSSCLQSSDFKIYSNGGEEALIEDVISESEEETGFSDGGVADEEDFEDKVVILREHW